MLALAAAVAVLQRQPASGPTTRPSEGRDFVQAQPLAAGPSQEHLADVGYIAPSGKRLVALPLRHSSDKREQHDLFVMAIRQYRTWGRALTAAGLDAEAISRRRKWTPERIIPPARSSRRRPMPNITKKSAMLDFLKQAEIRSATARRG